jgi:hypothetical protein
VTLPEIIDTTMVQSPKAGGEQYAVLPGEEPTVQAVRITSDSLDPESRTGEPVVIVAPTNLPGGYEFAACVNGETVTVKVVSI